MAIVGHADDARGVRKEHEEHGALDASPQRRLAEPQALRRLRDEARQPADEELVALFAVLLAVLLFEAAVDDGRADTSRRGRGVVRRVQLWRAVLAAKSQARREESVFLGHLALCPRKNVSTLSRNRIVDSLATPIGLT